LNLVPKLVHAPLCHHHFGGFVAAVESERRALTPISSGLPSSALGSMHLTDALVVTVETVAHGIAARKTKSSFRTAYFDPHRVVLERAVPNAVVALSRHRRGIAGGLRGSNHLAAARGQASHQASDRRA
jgi:hypothetical protein